MKEIKRTVRTLVSLVELYHEDYASLYKSNIEKRARDKGYVPVGDIKCQFNPAFDVVGYIKCRCIYVGKKRAKTMKSLPQTDAQYKVFI